MDDKKNWLSAFENLFFLYAYDYTPVFRKVKQNVKIFCRKKKYFLYFTHKS